MQSEKSLETKTEVMPHLDLHIEMGVPSIFNCAFFWLLYLRGWLSSVGREGERGFFPQRKIYSITKKNKNKQKSPKWPSKAIEIDKIKWTPMNLHSVNLIRDPSRKKPVSHWNPLPFKTQFSWTSPYW